MAEPAPPLDLAALCALARLVPGPTARAGHATRLEAVLTAFRTLGAVDTRGVAAPHVPADALRPDEPGACLGAETVLANAVHVAAGCFVVPRVVEG